MRIRQIVLAAADLAATVDRFERELGLRVAYRDPEVAKFGLVNALLPIGDQFLEIVSPTRPDTAAGRHLDRHGDSAYMLILQTDDLDRDRARLKQLSVRVVWESTFDDMRAAHLHPKDMGAAIVSLDEATPPDSWRWAGPHWKQYVASHDHKIVSATIRAGDPVGMARRWSQVLGLGTPQEISDRTVLPLRDGLLAFASGSPGSDRIVEFGLTGRFNGLPVAICGVTFNAGAWVAT